MRKPSLTLAALSIAFVIFFFVSVLPSGPKLGSKFTKNASLKTQGTSVADLQYQVDELESHNTPVDLSNDVIHGAPVSAKMTNETLKAELGRAGWKVFHTILAQYPEKPTQDERDTLKSFIYLWARMYPCRECAEHFQQMLKKYPPQTSSKEHASQWGCHVHNVVNERLGKPIFNCMDISDKYACGCDEDEEGGESKDEKRQTHSATETQEHLKGLKVDEKQDRTGG